MFSAMYEVSFYIESGSKFTYHRLQVVKSPVYSDIKVSVIRIDISCLRF
jgi:hypothetical protein